jgi:hypothetical protein
MAFYFPPTDGNLKEGLICPAQVMWHHLWANHYGQKPAILWLAAQLGPYTSHVTSVVILFSKNLGEDMWVQIIDLGNLWSQGHP